LIQNESGNKVAKEFEMIKKILIAILVIAVLLIGALAILAFMAPTDFKVEREITINKPKAEVFGYLKLIKNQSVWGPWFKKEPTMKQEFRGTDGTVGFTAYWNGTTDDVGEGEQEIKRIVEGERIDTELRFKRPFESKADAYLLTDAAGENQTKVKWGFSSSMPRPMNLMLLVMDMDKEVGKDFGEGLASLKTILEKQ
jgi:Polyketide cyclase / dehydrase and lipid transport